MIKSTFDKIVEAVSPSWAETRYRARLNIEAMSGGKLASESSEHTQGMDAEAHPDTDIVPDSGKQRRRCTLAFLNNALVRGIVDSEVRQAVGTVTVQAHTPSKRLNELIEDEWKRALDRGLDDMIRLGMRHTLIDGGSVPHRLGKPSDALDVEIIPYRLIKTPFDRKNEKIRDGFEYLNGKPVAVYVEQEESSYDVVYGTGQYSRVPLMGHAVLPRLAGQTKGLSWYSAAIVRLEMVNRWMMALLASAELHAYVIALVKTASQNTAGFAAGMTGATNQTGSTSQGDVNKRVAEYARKHRFLFLPEGADYKLVQANAPVIAEFLIWNLRFISRAIGVSFERLTYDLTHTSFSSTKFGDRDDRITVLEHQSIAERQILKPLSRELVNSIFLNSDAAVPGAGAFASNPEAVYSAVRFQLPGRPPVDEMKAEKANELAIRNRTASRTRIGAEKGDDHEEVLDEIMREDKLFIEKRTAMYVALGETPEEAYESAKAELQQRADKPTVDPEAEEIEKEEEKAKAQAGRKAA